MGRLRLTQQTIVFGIFAVMFAAFAIFLPGFATTQNIFTLLQNVAVLGILGLAMALVVIGRGIDISLIATLAVPSGLVLQMVQDGHGLPISIATAFLLSLAFGAFNGWLIAYAEVPSLFTTLASGLLLAGLGQAVLFKLDVVQWSPGMDGFEFLGQGNVLGVPMPVVVFALACGLVAFLLRRTRIGGLYLCDRRQSLRREGDGHSDPPGHCPAICAGGADRLLRRTGVGLIRQQRTHADLQLDPDSTTSSWWSCLAASGCPAGGAAC